MSRWSVYPAAVALCLVAAAHGVFAWQNRDLRPTLAVVTQPPSPTVRNVLAFGDRQFLYRAWGLDLQNAGDTGGRATPMRDYNYDFVIGWLESLRALDPRAQFHTHLAAHYFTQTPSLDDKRRVADFVLRDIDASPVGKWPIAMDMVELAETRLHDLPFALTAAQHLAAYDVPEIPNWVRMFPAVLLEKMGRPGEARNLVVQVQERYAASLTQEDRDWAATFLQRLPIPMR